VTGLYNKVDSGRDGHEYETLTGSATYLVSRNLRLIIEWTNSFETHKNRVVAGAVAAF
jgi:hypothetical protein